MEGVTFLAVLPNGVCCQSECGLFPSLWRCVSFCPISYHKAIGEREGRHRLDEEVLDAREELRQPVVGVGGVQEQHANRGSLCARRRCRKTVTCHGCRVVEPVYHQALLRGRWRSWRRASRQGQRCSCIFFKTHQICLLLCIVQSRRRPEKWTRTRKAGSRGSVTVDFVCVCTLFGLHFFHKTTVAGDAAVAGGAGGELRGRASRDVVTRHICSVSLCLCVPMERDKYVWLVQSRRRPVDRDLEGGLTRECNARPGFLTTCCV